MTQAKSKVYNLLSGFNQMKWSLAVKGILCGLVAGMLAVFYRLCIEFGGEKAVKAYQYFSKNPVFLIPWVLLIFIVGYVMSKLIKLEPMATGSGIPQVEGVVLFGLKMKWHVVLIVRYIAGTICSFFGLSLGREGPSIQIGAAGAQAVAEITSKNNRLEQNYLITGGAAAGLSAAFNAPISGMIFALEEVHRSFSPLVLLAATTAAITADCVSKYVFGMAPVLNFKNVPTLPMSVYLWLIPMGIVAGLCGAGINKGLLIAQTLYKKITPFWRPTLALLLTIPCGLLLPLTLNSGEKLIQFSQVQTTGIGLLLLYLIIKLIFTSTSFGSGVPGGIFMPILAVGTLSGTIIGIIATGFGVGPSFIPDFAICGMAGALAASVKAPITSIMLTVELSGKLEIMLPVAICTFTALLLSDLLKVEPIYEVLLERFVEGNGKSTPTQEKGGLHEFPVEYGSLASGNKVSQINWPSGSLIVAIRRGAKEIVPSGKTEILPGDYIVILSSEMEDAEVREKITHLCHAPEFDK